MGGTQIQEMMWRDVPGWEGFYQVSDAGLVRSLTRTIRGSRPCCPTRVMKGRVLKARLLKCGYFMVDFTAPGRKRARCYVHDLVLLAFVGPKPPNREVCHGPEGSQDNRLSNLRYDTQSENNYDRYRWGRSCRK